MKKYENFRKNKKSNNNADYFVTFTFFLSAAAITKVVKHHSVCPTCSQLIITAVVDVFYFPSLSEPREAMLTFPSVFLGCVQRYFSPFIGNFTGIFTFYVSKISI